MTIMELSQYVKQKLTLPEDCQVQCLSPLPQEAVIPHHIQLGNLAVRLARFLFNATQLTIRKFVEHAGQLYNYSSIISCSEE